MKLHEFISLNSIFVGVDVDSKKNVFKTVANCFEKKNPELSGKITEKLNERERLGTTAIGNGVAIPHTKIEGLKKTNYQVDIFGEGTLKNELMSLSKANSLELQINKPVSNKALLKVLNNLIILIKVFYVRLFGFHPIVSNSDID